MRRLIIRKTNLDKGFYKKIIQIPISYPQDVQILEDYQLGDNDAFEYFKVKIDFIKDFEGVFIFHTHPVHIASRLNLFVEVIKYAKSMGFEPLTMDDISSKILKLEE